MKHFKLYTFCVLLLLSCNLNAFLNLEEMSQDFVLETKKIDIPGYPAAFNPSIIRWGDSLLMCFRIRDPLTNETHQMGFIWLDQDFNLISDPYLLDTSAVNPYIPKRLQDVRLIFSGGDLYIVFNNVIGDVELEHRRMFTAKLHIDGERFYIDNLESILFFEGEGNFPREKNWTPFDYVGNLLLTYSIQPHLIFHPVATTQSCETVASTNNFFEWNWGQLRGGTPALFEGNEYLAFFHSPKEIATVQSQGKKITHYFMGAYTFSAEPPFAVTRISPEPIIGKDFYTAPPYQTWKPLRVVFPCGYIFDDQFIWVSYGRQDHEAWVVKLDKKKLLESLTPTTTVKSH